MILGLLIRLISIDKASGLWFDEIYCNYLASQKMPFDFFNKLYNEDFHAPLYFILLHFWMKLFGTTDIVLRLFSCLFGILAIPVAYFLGKEIRSEKLGIVCALAVALNSIHIYYSQEVKFYSLLFLLCSISLLFLLKYNKYKDKSNAIGLILSNTVILYTFTVSFTYVAIINLGYLLYLAIKKDKKSLKDFFIIQLVIISLYIPYIPLIMHHFSLLSHYFVNLAEVFYFNIFNVLTTIQMVFSPIVFNLANGVPIALKLKYILNLHFFTFAIVPTLICLFGLFKTLQKRNFNALILSLNICFIIFIFICAILHIFAFIPRFILMAMPAVLIFAMAGLFEIQNKKTAKMIIITYMAINFIYLIFIPYSAPRIERQEGYNSVAKILKAEDYTPKDLVIMPFAGKFLTRYINVNVLNLDFGKIYIRNKNNSLEMILDKNLIKQLNPKNVREKLRPYIFTSKIPLKFTDYLNKNVFEKLHKGERFTVIVNSNYYLDYKLMQLMKTDDKVYKKIALHHILYTKMVSHILGFSFKNFQLVKVVQSPDDVWVIYIFKKK